MYYVPVISFCLYIIIRIFISKTCFKIYLFHDFILYILFPFYAETIGCAVSFGSALVAHAPWLVFVKGYRIRIQMSTVLDVFWDHLELIVEKC